MSISSRTLQKKKKEHMKNATSHYDLTVIVPVYNEVDNMPRLESELSNFLRQAAVPSCVLFVDDGSRDTSLASIRDICRRQEHFFYIAFSHNCGLSAAMKAGIDQCRSRWVGYIDADLQTSPQDFNLLLPYAESYALVTGIRTGRKDTWWKRRQSRLANAFRRMMTGDTALDTGCPLKILHTDVARRIPFFNGMHRFLPALVLLQGEDFYQLPVRHFPRTAGISKFSMRNRFWGPLSDCFVYRWMKHRYIRYHIGESRL